MGALTSVCAVETEEDVMEDIVVYLERCSALVDDEDYVGQPRAQLMRRLRHANDRVYAVTDASGMRLLDHAAKNARDLAVLRYVCRRSRAKATPHPPGSIQDLVSFSFSSTGSLGAESSHHDEDADVMLRQTGDRSCALRWAVNNSHMNLEMYDWLTSLEDENDNEHQSALMDSICDSQDSTREWTVLRGLARTYVCKRLTNAQAASLSGLLCAIVRRDPSILEKELTAHGAFNVLLVTDRAQPFVRRLQAAASGASENGGPLSSPAGHVHFVDKAPESDDSSSGRASA